MTATKLTRNLDEAMLGGVLAGIASRYLWDPTLLRIVAALVTISTGVIPGVLIYLVAWVIIPRPDGTMPAPARVDSAAVSPAEVADVPETSEAAPPSAAAPQVPGVADEIGATLRDAADRLSEAATIAADAARRAANEIGDVARRPRAADDAPTADAPPVPTAASSPRSPAATADAATEDDQPTPGPTA